MTQVEAAKLVTVLLAAYPNARATEGTTRVYETMLADLDAKAANAAVQRLLATSKFMPTIAEVREAALALAQGERRPGGEAWGDVMREVHRAGRYRAPKFADPVVARAVAAFGWEAICDSENQVADRARFIELYDQLAQTARREQVSKSLPAVKAYRAELEERGQQGSSFGRVLRLVGGGDE